MRIVKLFLFQSLFMIFFCFSTFEMRAQQELFNWGIEPYYGSFQFSSKFDVPSDLNSFSYGLKINRRISNSFAWQFDIGGGNFDLVEVSKFNASSLSLDYRFDNGKILKERAFLAPYISLGLGYISFNPSLDKLKYNDGDWNATFDSGLKFRWGDRINTLFFVSGGIPFNSLSTNNYDDNPYFQKIGISLRYNLGMRESNFKGTSYLVNESHALFNPLAGTVYSSIIGIVDSTFKFNTDSTLSKQDTVSTFLSELLLMQDFSDADKTINESIINTNSPNRVLDTLLINKISGQSYTVFNTADSSLKVKDSIHLNLFNQKGKDSIVNLKLKESITIKSTESKKIIKVDSINNGINTEGTMQVSIPSELNKNSVVHGSKLIKTDTVIKPRIVNFKLEGNQLRIISEKGEPLDFRIDKALFEQKSYLNSTNSNTATESFKIESKNIVPKEKEIKTKTAIIPAVVPVRKTDTVIKTIILRDFNEDKPSNIILVPLDSTNIGNQSEAKLSKMQTRDSVIDRILTYEVELTKLITAQQKSQMALERRLSFLEQKPKAKSIVPIVSINSYKPDTIREIIRDTIYKYKPQSEGRKELETKTVIPFKKENNEVTKLIFSLNTYKVQNTHYIILNQLIAGFKKENGHMLLITGYSDMVGDATYNLKLSKFRAESVKKYLIQNGISEEKIIVRFFGEKYSSPATIKLDRKVEIEILTNNK